MLAQPSVRTKCVVGVLPLFLLTGVLAAAEFAGGTGTADDPYQIATAEQLCSIGSERALFDKHFVLVVDIDLDSSLPGGKVFHDAVIAPLSRGSGFAGVFDGAGHTISNLTIEGTGDVGLFGSIAPSGTVRNVGIVGANIMGSGCYVGGLVGSNEGRLIRCYCLGVVAGRDFVGGLAGESPGPVTECHGAGAVAGDNEVGGLVGASVDGRMVRCYSTATVSATGNSVGGLIGYLCGGSVTASYGTGAVSGDGYVGGLVGRSYESIVSCCYTVGAVRGGMHIGGLLGQNWAGYVTDCYSAGAVAGESTFGGLVGSNLRPEGVIGCFWDAESSGQASSVAGTGVSTAQMQDLSTFLAAGWDFTDEIANGTCDYWQMSAGGYPELCCHAGVGPLMPEGAGTAQEPYLIRDADDLGVVWFEPEAHYRLEASIDLSGIAWHRAVVPWFGGTFDGNDCVIRNLHVEGNGYLGLFGQSSPDAVISNLGLEAVEVNGTASYVGGLVGRHAGRIAASFCSGAVAGDSLVGGLVGENDGGIETSHATGAVDGTSVYAGGLTGRSYGKIAESYSAGTVHGGAHVGGLAGCNDGDIRASYSTAGTDGTGSYVGGLVGYNSGRITTSHSSGVVNGPDHVGGFVGCNEGSVATSYSRGAVDGVDLVGGFAGHNSVVGSIASSFWDIETSGWTTSAAGEGKTTTEMQTASTFLDAGWDFANETANGTDDIWWITEGQDYPRLWWE
ncbi:MAG: hypothetical protein KBE65_14525 [Phycisphaerae bacterium]|nr:hypothetical protein [Phycisphaerae bacterium]